MAGEGPYGAQDGVWYGPCGIVLPCLVTIISQVRVVLAHIRCCRACTAWHATLLEGSPYHVDE